MHVSWYEQSQSEVPAQFEWLSDWEKLHLSRLRIPKRRADWLLGRWTAKQAIADFLRLPGKAQALRGIEIWPAPSGAPYAFIDGCPGEMSISLTHREGIAACALGPTTLRLGCDYEVVEPRSDAFLADYFTEDERKQVRNASSRERFAITALIWSAKESALKAMAVGLRGDPRGVCVALHPEPRTSYEQIDLSTPSGAESTAWKPMMISFADHSHCYGLWSWDRSRIRTLVCFPVAEGCV